MRGYGFGRSILKDSSPLCFKHCLELVENERKNDQQEKWKKVSLFIELCFAIFSSLLSQTTQEMDSFSTFLSFSQVQNKPLVADIIKTHTHTPMIWGKKKKKSSKIMAKIFKQCSVFQITTILKLQNILDKAIYQELH